MYDMYVYIALSMFECITRQCVKRIFRVLFTNKHFTAFTFAPFVTNIFGVLFESSVMFPGFLVLTMRVRD